MPDLVKSINNIASKKRMAFSPSELLDHLVNVADQITKKFSVDMLYTSNWHVDGIYPGSFCELVSETSKELGYPSGKTYYCSGWGYRPADISNKKTQGLGSGYKKEELSLRDMVVLNEDLFNTAEDFMIRHYMISSSWDHYDKYYYNEYNDSKYFSTFKKIYAFAQHMKGRRDMDKMLDGIRLLLEKQNPQSVKVGIDFLRGDLYKYKNKLFFVNSPITVEDHRGQEHYFKDERTRFDHFYLNWAYAIFSYKELDERRYESKPIAYKILEYNEQPKLANNLNNKLIA